MRIEELDIAHQALRDVCADVFKPNPDRLEMSIVSMNDGDEGQAIIVDDEIDPAEIAKRLRMAADVVEREGREK